jgi:hypothetical protein
MDFYAAGAREARETFIKEADYADRAAKLWEHLQPTQTPIAARAAGGLAGGIAGLGAGGLGGAAWGGRHPGLLGVTGGIGGFILGGAGGGLAGGATGAGLGQAAVHKVHKMLTQSGRAGAIRKYAPGAAAAIGATALAASLAHHFLSRGDEKEAGFDFLSPEVAKYMRIALAAVPIATGAAMKYTMPKVPPPVVQPMKAPGAPPSLTASK